MITHTSIRWYIPFTYSIETFGINGFTNQVNSSNLFDQIVWMEPGAGERIGSI